MITTASTAELEQALKIVDKEFNGNITFNRYPEPVSSKRNAFTLKVLNSSGIGARRSHSGRKLISACWHVHGKFFDTLFEINPNVIVKTGNKTITEDAGNWEDWNIGSTMNPLYFSEACNCE